MAHQEHLFPGAQAGQSSTQEAPALQSCEDPVDVQFIGQQPRDARTQLGQHLTVNPTWPSCPRNARSFPGRASGYAW